MHPSRLFRTFEASIVLLFFVQAVRVLFSVIFGVIYDTIFSGTVALSTLGLIMVCVITAFLTALVAPRRGYRTLLFATAVAAALARVFLTINQPTVRLWSGILIIAVAGIYIATLLRWGPRIFPMALLLAFATDQFLRAAGDTYDISLRGWWLPAQIAFSLITGGLAWLAFSRTQTKTQTREGIGVIEGLALGALLFLETSLLSFPNALARWSEVDYAIVTPLLLMVTLLPQMPGIHIPRGRQSRIEQLGGLAYIVIALVGLVAGKQGSGLISALGLLATQFLVLIALSDIVRPHRSDRTGLALVLGFIFFLGLNFALAFAFTYPYTIPAFRGAGLYVFLVATVMACSPVLCASHSESGAPKLKSQWFWLVAALVVLLTVIFAWQPSLNLKEAGPVRVATYNMHYGYNTSWRVSLEEQARTIEESGADIVTLQEVDACRITSYGIDNALWLSRRLGMQAVYGPALEGLSGVALLTRFPVTEADTRLLVSQLEQTAIVHAQVMVGNRPLDAYGVWLGLEPQERKRQLAGALSIIDDASPVVFGGDFNATPDSSTYAHIQAAGFDDPFVLGGFHPAPTSPAINPTCRIDFVWTRGLEALDARVLDSLASDHRLVVVEATLNGSP